MTFWFFFRSKVNNHANQDQVELSDSRWVRENDLTGVPMSYGCLLGRLDESDSNSFPVVDWKVGTASWSIVIIMPITFSIWELLIGLDRPLEMTL